MSNVVELHPTGPSGNSVVAANIRAAIAYADINQATLARALGLSEMALSRRLSDNYRPEFNASEITVAADFFGLEPGDLFRARPLPADAKNAPFPKEGGEVWAQRGSNPRPAD